MFHFSGSAHAVFTQHATLVFSVRFPHSEIPGSKVATHLPETYRSYATSFIAFSSQGIHHTPLFRPDKKCFIVPKCKLSKNAVVIHNQDVNKIFSVYSLIVNKNFIFKKSAPFKEADRYTKNSFSLASLNKDIVE